MPTEPDDFTCINCGGVARPFGTMRHWFGDSQNLLCLECAREIMPERVAIAEAFEAEWSLTDSNTEPKPE